jgi:hypothetical protein
MIIERTSKEIIFRLPRKTSIDDLQDLADFFEFTESTKDFDVKQNEVDDLVKTIKKGRWNRTKSKLD